MVSLLDIAPQTRTVPIASGDLILHGLGLRQIADLFLTCPSLANLFSDGVPQISVTEIVLQAPEAVGAIIAAAADQPDAADLIVDKGLLTPDEILDCLIAIVDLTFPRGLGPLMERLALLVRDLVARGGEPGMISGTTAPPPPNTSSRKATAPALS